MSGATIFVVGMAILLALYFVAMVKLFRDNTVVRKPTLNEEMAKLAASINEVQRAFAEAFRPVVEKTIKAMNEFARAWERKQ